MKNISLFLFAFLFLSSLLKANPGNYPRDSGSFDNMHLRTGKWIVYDVDSFHKYPPLAEDVDRIRSYYEAKIILNKYVGVYKNGHREGAWKFYICNANDRPYNWSLRKIVTYKNGNLDGPWKYLSASGKTLLETSYRNGYEDGTQTFYYRTGKIQQKTQYSKGNKNGKQVIYFPNGKKQIERNLAGGYFDGPYNLYFDNGQLRFKREYKEGLLWNESKLYNNRGVAMQIGNFKNGDGELYMYDDYGNVMLVCTYSGGKRNGPAKEYYVNGKVSREMNYVNDSINGPEKRYNENGVKTQESTIVKGKYEGAYKYFYPNGKLRAEYFYKNGIFNSVISTLDTLGNPLPNGDFVNGNGVVLYYDDSCRLKSSSTYKNGIRNGMHTFYFPNSKPQYQYNLVNDTLQGIDRIFFANGNLFREGNVINGLWDGPVKQNFIDGKPSNEMVYKKGVLWNVNYQLDTTGKKVNHGNFRDGSGKLIYYTDSGYVISEITYENGIRNGKKTVYRKDGNILKEENYVNDSLSGTMIVYYPDHTPQFVTEYKNGRKNGVSRVYHSNGVLWTERIYVNDKLWNVTVNMNSLGEKVDKGTIKNGNGTVNQYDESGALVHILQCTNGYIPEWEDTDGH
jgi:antitoxin component YwqK of YwqJK toxin-antitoxin module